MRYLLTEGGLTTFYAFCFTLSMAALLKCKIKIQKTSLNVLLAVFWKTNEISESNKEQINIDSVVADNKDKEEFFLILRIRADFCA
jgi:hypothetical protein